MSVSFVPMLDCLASLTKSMKTGLVEFDEEKTEKAPLADNGEVEESSVSHWITEIENAIMPYDDPHGQLNPYYLPEVAKEFSRMAKEFVMWSSVLVSAFRSPFSRGTSSPVENAFADLKRNILKGEAKPLKANNFVAIHIQAIEGACRIADSAFDSVNMSTIGNEQAENKECVITSELNEVENWRGLGSKPKRSKYLSAFPGADIAVASTNFKAASHGLLKNGSGRNVRTADGTVLIVNNTCTFDALCHLVTNAYMTFESYRDQMTKSVNNFIQTAVTLAQEGPVNKTYVKRAETLATVLDPTNELRMPTTRRRSLGLEYNAFGNCTNILKKMIHPHTSQEVMCEEENHCTKKLVLDPNSLILANRGLEALNESLTDCRRQCSQCVVRYGDHIFVDVEFLSDELYPRDNCATARLYSLRELPKQLALGNATYNISGAVSYTAAHYVAYCFSVKWRMYNDLAPKATYVEETTEIWPSVLMYVK